MLTGGPFHSCVVRDYGQLRACADTAEEEAADAGGGGVVDVNNVIAVPVAILMVRATSWAILCSGSPPAIVISYAVFSRSYPPLWPFLTIYAVWSLLDRSPEHGGRISYRFRSSRFWKYFADYYPAS